MREKAVKNLISYGAEVLWIVSLKAGKLKFWILHILCCYHHPRHSITMKKGFNAFQLILCEASAKTFFCSEWILLHSTQFSLSKRATLRDLNLAIFILFRLNGFVVHVGLLMWLLFATGRMERLLSGILLELFDIYNIISRW